MREAGLWTLVLLAPLGGCGSTAESAYLRVPPAREPRVATRVGRWVGELLGSDPARSAQAEARLLSLVGPDRERLAEHAQSIPLERDPRWLLVLDEQGLLPPQSAEEHVALQLWKARRPEPFFVMKARAALTEQARRAPGPVEAAVAAGLPGSSQAALALALAGRRDSAPVLLERYVASEDEDERRALAEALRLLLGEETRLRVGAPREERARRAAEIQRRLQVEDAAASGAEGVRRG